MPIILIIIFMLFNVYTAEAQEEPEIIPETEKVKPFRIGAGLGYSFTGYRDTVESPINRYANALTFLVDGNIEKGNFFHSLNINFFKGNPRMPTPYETYIHKSYISIRGCIEYALDHRLWGNETFPGYLGGAFRTLVYYTGTDGNEDEAPLPTGVGLFSLDLHATQKWIINDKHTLTFSAGYPVFGYAVRPPYAGLDGFWIKYIYEKPFKIITLGRISSFHNYWAILGDLKYHYKVLEFLSSYAGLGFELSRFNFPRPRVDAIFRLNAGIAFTF